MSGETVWKQHFLLKTLFFYQFRSLIRNFPSLWKVLSAVWLKLCSTGPRKVLKEFFWKVGSFWVLQFLRSANNSSWKIYVISETIFGFWAKIVGLVTQTFRQICQNCFLRVPGNNLRNLFLKELCVFKSISSGEWNFVGFWQKIFRIFFENWIPHVQRNLSRNNVILKKKFCFTSLVKTGQKFLSFWCNYLAVTSKLHSLFREEQLKKLLWKNCSFRVFFGYWAKTFWLSAKMFAIRYLKFHFNSPAGIFLKKNLFWKRFYSLINLGHLSKYFWAFWQFFPAYFSKMHSTCRDEPYEKNKFFRKVLVIYHFRNSIGKFWTFQRIFSASFSNVHFSCRKQQLEGILWKNW